MTITAKKRRPKKRTKAKAVSKQKPDLPTEQNDEAANSAVGKRLRTKSLKIEEAREHGIDESKVAEGYANMHAKLGRSEDKGDLKLFFDVLKENSRVLEPPRPADRSGVGENVTVVLRHNVPRPQR